MEDYAAYFAHAKMLTRIYALPKPTRPHAEMRKQPLQASNVNVGTDLSVTCAGRLPVAEAAPSPDTPQRPGRPHLQLDDDFSATSPKHCVTPGGMSCKSPFVGSLVKAKRFRSSMRRL